MATNQGGHGGVRPLPEITLADLDTDPELERLNQAGLSARLRLSFSDMRKATRYLLDEDPSEARLLFFVLLSDVIFFLNFGLKFVLSPSAEGMRDGLPSEFAGAIGGLVTLCFLVRTATLYVFSGAVTIGCRILGGRGSWRDTRAGIFWASLVAAPFGVVGALLVVALGYLETISPVPLGLLEMPAQLIGVIAFVFFVSASVAESHRFRRTSSVFIAFSIVTVAVLLGGLYLVGQILAAL